MQISTQGLFDPTAQNYDQVPYIQWKDKTYQQVVSTIQMNNPYPYTSSQISGNLLQNALPLKIYRRELGVYNVDVADVNPIMANSCNPRTSVKIDILNRPNGYLVNPQTEYGTQLGLVNTLDMKTTDVKIGLPNGCTSTLNVNGVCFDAGQNSLKRVRSAGMIVKKSPYVAPYNGTVTNPDHSSYNAPFSTSSKQYLYSRGKTFDQNQSRFLKAGDSTSTPGTLQSQNNKYAVNTGFNYCPNPDTNYIPTYYKPNNPQFAQQGAVSSSDRLLRLKYDTMTTNGGLYSSALGSATGNAMAYGGSPNPYSVKEKIGYPLTKTPVFSKYCNTFSCSETTSSVKQPL